MPSPDLKKFPFVKPSVPTTKKDTRKQVLKNKLSKLRKMSVIKKEESEDGAGGYGKKAC